MKLIKFRIQNFRSIEDTETVILSKDGITTLVGQNESGKSSILKGLNVLQSLVVEEDDIREETKNPIFIYWFHLDETNELKKILDEAQSQCPAELGIEQQFLTTSDMVSLQAEWDISTKKFSFTINDSCDLGKFIQSYTCEEVLLTQFDLWTKTFIVAFCSKIPKFILFENNILPNKIYLEQLLRSESNVNGYLATLNFLNAVNLDIKDLDTVKADDRKLENIQDKINSLLTSKLDAFWSQYLMEQEKIRLEFVLKLEPKTQKYYLSFWAKDSSGTYTLSQRSSGAQWFISFFLAIMATQNKQDTSSTVLLIDEPGIYLHPVAQKDILNLLEQSKTKMQVIYSTHSPFLIDLQYLNRLLIVERLPLSGNGGSHTQVNTPQKVASSNTDALLPLYSKLGIDITQLSFIIKSKTILVEELSAFYYLQGFIKLLNKDFTINILPATGADNIPFLANLAIGLGLDFIIILDNDKKGKGVEKALIKEHLIEADKIIPIEGDGIEDLFEPIDFKKISECCTIDFEQDESPSVYCKKNKLSKPLVAKTFKVNVEEHTLALEDLSDSSKKRIERLIQKIEHFITM